MLSEEKLLKGNKITPIINYHFFLLIILSFLIIPTNSWAKKKKRIKIKIATTAPNNTPWTDALNTIKKKLNKASKKRFRGKLYPGAILGGEKFMLRSCSKGKIQIFAGSPGAVAAYAPIVELLELPFLFDTNSEVDYIIDKVVHQVLYNAIYEKGFVLMGWSVNGWQNMANSKRLIKSLSDLKGLKMRSQETALFMDTWKAFGASPIPIAVTEVLSALQVNIIDGFAQTPLYTFATSWYQGIKYYSLTRHIYQPAIVVASRKWYDALPQDLQKVFLESPKKIIIDSRKNVRKLSPVLLENLKKAGVQTYTLTEQERRAIAKPAQKVHTKYIANASPGAQKLYRKIIAALKKRRKTK